MRDITELSFLLSLLSIGVALSLQQSSISLNSAQWLASNSNNSIIIPAQVPGGIYSDLRRSNVLKQDILVGKNDIAYRWVGNENWTYTTAFTIDHQIARSQSVRLVLHGVDTVSTIILNGHEIGTTDNMFVRYRFDIKPYLKLAGVQNILVVKFESPIKYGARKSRQSIRSNRGKIIPPYCPSPAQKGECHVNFIRKMQASFSWDWGPAFPSVGLYKDVNIEFGSFGIIRDILVETKRLPSLIPLKRVSTPPPQVVISSNIRQQVRVPTVNRTVPYVRAPPYYMALNDDNRHLMVEHAPPVVDITTSSEASNQLLEENWLLKTTLVAEMVQPSFGYNIRVEFNLNGILHYESEHINVVANSDGFVRLGFNLRIDSSRMQIKPWWPNNAGSQTLYKLSARMMPIPNPSQPSDSSRLRTRRSIIAPDQSEPSLQFRDKPPQTAAIPLMVFLVTQYDTNHYRAQHVSEKEIMFGFRTVELIQEPVNKGNLDEGVGFNFRINGVDLFAMGSNWIPSNILPEYGNDFEYMRYLLQSAKDANMNMLRVWGGGMYESDEFYHMADQMGIMIWHDFMFACALYPSDDEFLSSVRLEIEQQVQRLQHHPSIVLWAGNNENEMAIAGPWWPEVLLWNKKLRESYAQLYVDTIRPIVQILDPSRPYLESSPSNGVLSRAQQYTIARTPNDNRYGDVHHYDYMSDSFEWSSFPSTRFASEYGYQSYPSFTALASISTPNDWKYPLTSNILHRQHRLTGEAEIKLQIKMHFNDLDSGGIDKLKTFLYVSQLTQAIAIKTETEFYRRNRFIDPETKLGRTMGALYWQLNDVWQAPTWASIEYGGKWKMLHYFARRFFFPIQVMPYIVSPSGSSGPNNIVQQLFTAGTTLLSNSPNRHHQQSTDPQQELHNIQQQQQPPLNVGGPLLVIDLVRDDLFHLLDSFNVTIKFYRWTSFVPVWQDSIYVRHTRPQNVTRIYEHELARIVRQPGVISLSSGVFQVLIEQQPRLGLSQIDNYLMPVLPSKVTAMRVPKISAELIQGPFELTEAKSSSGSSSQWSCAYRITLVSDSIAMFVWLDLNLVNSVDTSSPMKPASGEANEPSVHREPPENIHLDALPPSMAAHELRPSLSSLGPPEHIRLHLNGQRDAMQFGNFSIAMDQAASNSNRRARRRQTEVKIQSQSGSGTKNQHPNFTPLDDTGSDMLRFQFSDNAFNMFESSKVIDLYLNRCLSKSQIEVALEIQSLADCL